jgi:hypothetical protein
MRRKKLPSKLKYQKLTGMTLLFSFSDTIHCKKNRMKNRLCPRNPIVSNHQCDDEFMAIPMLKIRESYSGCTK